MGGVARALACATLLAACGAPVMLAVPAGRFVAGSTAAEREQAYADAARTAGDDRARRGRWFDDEEEQRKVALPAFRLDRLPVTHADYARFLAATGRSAPRISADEWRSQGYVQDYAREVARFNWIDGRPPAGRERHPVVLVTHAEAAAYCAWRGARLPTALELERAARGDDGRIYPWGNAYDPSRLNDRTSGPHDTMPVGSFPAGPYGHHDLAGNVFEWTATAWRRPGEFVVKGSAWDDHGGVGRGAARHGRPATVRHAIVGFRCASS